ncbi:hypothetical protein WJX84_001675 [Apatococcus fuscideae]|uniref:RBR-type E3 ubiquitin transferase n=1 Tax=Apatococcus fuscideae TaxID=2026836 RepID=A0AAW1STK8_9CHLO
MFGDEQYLEHSTDAAAPRTAGPLGYSVLTPDRLHSFQDKALADVAGVLACSVGIARTLLIYFRWNVENLFAYLADHDQNKLYKAAGAAAASVSASTESAEEEHECQTCFTGAPLAETTVMSCGHRFCNDCWSQHCSIAVREGGSKRLKCMGVNCRTFCDADKVYALLGDAELLAKYQQALLESFVDDNDRAKWCPSVPHCGNAIQAATEMQVDVTCSCSKSFCFNCTEEPHTPCTCDMWKAWLIKTSGDSETTNWLQAFTKNCPKCSKPVEKASGCNLVMCRCGQPFCWLCGAATGVAHDYTRIVGHECGRYKEDADAKAASASRDHKRYTHYNTRYEAHMQSLKMENKQREDMVAKIQQLEQEDSSAQDSSWLMQALEQLSIARRILGCTYVFAYTVFADNSFPEDISAEQNSINQTLFENLQQQLEAEVERLSGLIEAPIQEILAQNMRLSAIDSTASIDARLRNLYQYIENDILGNIHSKMLDISPYKGKSMLEASLAPLPLAEGVESTAASPGPSSALTADVIDLTDSPLEASASDPKRQRIASPRAPSPQGPFRNLRRLVGRS